MDAEQDARPGGRLPGARRPAQRARRKLRAEAGAAALALALLVAGLGFGAQHRPVLVVAVLLSAVAAALSPRGLPLSRLASGLLVLAAFTVLTAVPLPFGLVRVLSPATAEVWAGALRPFREPPPAWISLSLDPGSTWLEALKLSSYACVAVAAAGLRARRGSPAVATLVFGAAVAVCVVTLAHGIVRAPLIYGAFPPIDTGERWTRGPFVNGNNLAAYLNVGLFAGAALWLGGRSPLPAVVTAIGVPMLAAGVVLGGSRGGVVSLLVASAFLGGLTLSRRMVTPARAILGFAVVLVVAALGLVVLGDERLKGSLLESGVAGKLLGFRWTLPMIADFPLFGVGRGAFEGGFQPYRGAQGDASTIYVHAENLVLDWVGEWGLPVGLLAVAALGFTSALLIVRARRDATLSGLAAAIVAVLLGAMVDFGVEIYGIAALVVVVLSTAEAPRVATQGSRSWLPFVPVAVTAALLLVALGVDANTARADRNDLKALVALGAAKPSHAELQQRLRAQTLRHPGDGYLPLLGAYLAGLDGKSTLPWLGRALERNPRSGRAHLALGEALGRMKQRSQALIHFRHAAIYDHSLSDRALREAVLVEPDLAALSRAFPQELVGGSAFVDLCPRIALQSRIACYREALRRDARNRKVHADFALELLDALEAKREPCVGQGAALCETEAVRSSELLGAGAGDGYRDLVIAARITARKGDVLRAVTSLLAGCPATPGASECLELAVELSFTLPDKSLARQAEQRFIAVACEVPARCASAHSFLADKREKVGDLVGALEQLTSAAREAPSAARWLKVADMAARAMKPSAKRAALVEAKTFGALTGQQSREVARLESERDGPLPP